MNSDPILICEGYSMNYLIPSTFVLLLALCALAIFPILFFPLAALGISGLLIKSGVELNKDREFRSYKSVFGKRVGHFFSLDAQSRLILLHSKSAAIMHSRGSSTRVRQQSFDLYLVDGNNKTRIHEFTDRRFAVDCKRQFKRVLGVEVEDHYGRKLAQSKKKQTRKERHASNHI